MNCGNNPTQPLTPGDLAVVDWYREWLAWSKTPEDDRGPEPVCPDGRAINIAARAQTTRCGRWPNARTHSGITPNPRGGEINGSAPGHGQR